MPLFVKIDFRADGRLGAWWTRAPAFGGGDFSKTTTSIEETRIRDVFIALADELDPETPEADEQKGNQ